MGPAIPGNTIRKKGGDRLLILMGRTLLFYALLLAAMRLLGKRQLGDLELSELVVTVLIADIAVSPIVNNDVPVHHALSQLAVLFGCEWLLSYLSMKSLRLRTLLFGRPSVLMEHGRICQQEMRKNRFTVDELLQELRLQGVLDLKTVDYAILETSGELNVILKAEEQPVTPSQLGIQVPEGGWYTILVSDGRVLKQQLTARGRNDTWLKKTLQAYGCGEAKDCFLLLMNDAGETYFSPKEA